ncbi:uncharacterized protein MKK02DRAFT_40703 [Dioszegia hungarica]|uniref:Sugar phosphate transporter domain-containing protein n=1 Tax=Dioszegia hungarica TaxID=4972 RepID=A0AA38LSC2_9TREE|nr:uncharacterized protein MKK02DRAFT_40703 [Dioszegia hungarica]KAI9632399.1 hypothetical protein MKK02DRAFT_40703 [Dioszegia hungarica]
MPSPQAEAPSQLAVLGVIGFYMFVAISMTMLNKRVLSSNPLPVFLLFCQSAVAVGLLWLENKVGPFKTPKFDMKIAKALVPLTLVNVLGLCFNNYCLQYVDASFHQVARGMVLPATIVISMFALNQHPSRLTIAAASVVTVGFFSGVLFDPNHASSKASAAVSSSGHANLGIMFGALSSVASAGHAVLIKRGLAVVNNSPMALSYYNNILSTVFLLPLIVLSGELPGTVRIFQGFEAKTFIIGASITGFFGFLISLAAMLSIKVTSPVTHMISSAVRGVLQTFFAVYLFGDVGRIISIFLITAGSGLYVYAKSEESKATAYQPVPPSSDPRSLERGVPEKEVGYGLGLGLGDEKAKNSMDGR